MNITKKTIREILCHTAGFIFWLLNISGTMIRFETAENIKYIAVVNGVNHPRVQLLADTIHMITSGEDPACIQTFLPSIRHVHVSDWERRLPQFGYSPELTAVIRNLALSGYDITCSFEVKQSDDDLALQRALLLLKAALRH